ncbi:chromosome partitioning protein ParA [Vibrio sp. WJH972]
MVSINNSTGFVLLNNNTNLNSTKPNQGQGVDRNTMANTNVSRSDATSSIQSTEKSHTTQSTQPAHIADNQSVITSPSSKNAVASAVALSVKAMKSDDYQQSQVQYDLPEGKSRKAMQQYFDVMSHNKREELSQMLGVDMYV